MVKELEQKIEKLDKEPQSIDRNEFISKFRLVFRRNYL